MKFSSSVDSHAFSVFCCCGAQDLNDKVLMTVTGTRVTAGEFIRMYRKSLEPGKNRRY